MNTCFISLYISVLVISFIVCMYIFSNLSIPSLLEIIVDKTNKEITRVQQLEIWVFVVSVLKILGLLGLFFNTASNVYLMNTLLVPVYILLALVYIYLEYHKVPGDNTTRKTYSAIDLFVAMFFIDLVLHLIFIYSVKRKKVRKLYKPLKPFNVFSVLDIKKFI